MLLLERGRQVSDGASKILTFIHWLPETIYQYFRHLELYRESIAERHFAKEPARRLCWDSEQDR